MANIVEIANFALGNVAEQRITTLEDNSEPARLCLLHIAQSVREVLAMGRWKCARKPAELNLLTEAPLFGWEKAFQLPVDFIRLVSLNDLDPDDIDEPIYEVQGRTLLTDEDVASIVYVRDLTVGDGNVNDMTPLLTKAAVLTLAAKLAWPLQQSRTLQENLEQRADLAVRKALAAEAQEERRKPVNQRQTSNWASARFTGN